MRKLRIFEHISLDGIIEASGGPYGDWTAPYRTPEGFAAVTTMYGENFDLVLGRTTYDQWSKYWPTAPSNPMSDRLNAAKKYIVTHHPDTLAWGPFEGVTNLVEGVRNIKATDGADIIVCGSSTLTSTLIQQGLADELILMVNPVLLGTGKRLFAEGTPPRSFQLQNSNALPSGIVINTYSFAGSLQNLK